LLNSALQLVFRTKKQQKGTKNVPQTKRRAAGKSNRKKAPRAKKNDAPQTSKPNESAAGLLENEAHEPCLQRHQHTRSN
jgi:hypothetical protein